MLLCAGRYKDAVVLFCLLLLYLPLSLSLCTALSLLCLAPSQAQGVLGYHGDERTAFKEVVLGYEPVCLLI